MFEIPACRVLLSYKGLQGFHSVAILRKSYGLDSCGAQPAPGRWHDAARPCLPRSPEAASPQAAPLSSGHATVTTTRAPRLVPRHGLSESSLAESHTASPSSMERGMLTRPRLRRSSSWRSRHRTGPHSESGIRRPPMAARAASAFGASRGSATVSSPFSGPKPSVSRHSRLRTCDFALCSQRLARLASQSA